MKISKTGEYFETETGRYHISIKSNNIHIRCVEVKGFGTPRLFTHMPAGNIVVIAAENEIDQ